jgi:hypothetical protein
LTLLVAGVKPEAGRPGKKRRFFSRFFRDWLKWPEKSRAKALAGRLKKFIFD